MADDPPELLLPDAAAWRAWLLAHHGSAHTGTPCTGSGPSSRTALPTWATTPASGWTSGPS